MTRIFVCSLLLVACAGGEAPPIENDPVETACDCGERICGRLDCGAVCGTCPSDSTCAGDGLSCIAPLPVGSACRSDRECGLGRTCLLPERHLPGGYCTRACSDTEACPEGSECGLSREGQPVCLATCQQADACRASEGYACVGGACEACVGSCEGLECGDDGCGGECGLEAGVILVCYEQGDVCSSGQCSPSFSYFGDLDKDRWDIAALPNSRGEIILVGGRERIQYAGQTANIQTRGVAKVEIFDPSKKSFVSMTPLPEAIARPHAALVKDTIYVAGGTFDPDKPAGQAGSEDTAVTKMYRQDRGAWAQLPLPEASMGGSAESVNDELYLLPGEVDGVPSNSFWVYRNLTWESLPPRPTARTLFSSASDGQRLWVVGGWDGTRAVATVESWSAETGWETWPELPMAVVSSRAVVANDRVFVFGGFTHPDGGDVRAFVQSIDVATGRTRLLGTTREHLTRQAPAFVRTGQVLLFGAYLAEAGVPLPRTDILQFLVPEREGRQ